MRANLDKNPHDVQSMFNAVAGRYDLMNFLASLGQEKVWRAHVKRAVVTRPFLKVLDVAAGTGASSIEFVRAGGHVVVCEFSRPTFAPFRAVYRFFLHRIMPPIARLFSTDAVAYDYLAESILAWPSQYEFAAHLRAAGFERLQLKNLTGGIVALHRGYKLK